LIKTEKLTGSAKKEMNIRYKVTPQIKCYDSIGESFTPYLMRKDNGRKSFKSVSTNEYGFRNTIGHDGKIVDFEKVFQEEAGDFGIILGSSAVFGTGATNDNKSIASCLSKSSGINWLNFGARAYNSTQELVLLCLHLKAKPKHIVIFSGVNNLTLAHLCQKTSRIYNSFFGESAFREAINTHHCPQDALIKSFKKVFCKILHKFGLLKSTTLSELRKNIEEDYEKILNCFERDLLAISTIARGHGSSINFFMQPLATWLDKKLCNEEKELFEYLDNLNPDFKILSEFLGFWKTKYFCDVERICKDLGVHFTNLNCSDFEGPEWLFVDRVHLTDSGYSLVANLINRQIES
jgi:hypothetical protein